LYMARRRFFVTEVRRGQAELTGDQAHHLRNVLRVEVGQRYEISDGERVYLAGVEVATKRQVVFQVEEELAVVEPPARVRLYLSLVKFDRFELAVEKTTELGVERIVPVFARRSEKGLAKAAGKRMNRWRKIALEACQQSRRARLPVLADPLPLPEALAGEVGWKYFLDEVGSAPPLLNFAPLEHAADDAVALLVGPEGGWVDGERDLAREAGWSPVSLGPQILRAETAAIVATAVVMSAWARP